VGVFEDLGRGLGEEENIATLAKNNTSFLEVRTDMIFFLKNKNLGFLCFSLVFYLWWVGCCSLLLILGFVGRREEEKRREERRKEEEEEEEESFCDHYMMGFFSPLGFHVCVSVFLFVGLFCFWGEDSGICGFWFLGFAKGGHMGF
jgi:hypothetical protein